MPARSRFTVLVPVVAASMTVVGVTAPAIAFEQPDITLAQAAPSPAPEDMQDDGEGAQSDQPDQPDMMHSGKRGDRMRRGMPMMRGHMMKMMFVIADTDGDRALSFEEVSAIHKRIFDAIDADKDGKMTREELQTFMRE